jgi:gamma-glutamyltranspeptidase/glutathione hydrolase
MASSSLPGKHASGVGAVLASGHPLAASAARRMLQAGGSAVDAAIAADAVMGVVEPMATSIGGDLQAMIVEPDGHAITCNGTGRAPLALNESMVAALAGGRLPERHPLTVTVPGAVRGWHDLHQRYGKLPWPSLLQPAIEVAEEGFAVAKVAAREWRWFQHVLRLDAACAELYRAERPPEAGERFANPELAAVLRAIAADGPDAFYSGWVARAMVRGVQAHDGVLSERDLESHSGDWRAPLQAGFRGLTLLECPPNSHGCAVLEALQQADHACRDLDPASPQAMLELVRATGTALARARATVTDPSGNTVCTVVVDGSGLAVTLMSSIFKRFGCGIVAPGCGFVLQNRGFGFGPPGHANAPAPGKRPYHTVIPAAALKDGRHWASFGVVGGLMQPQGHIQLLWRLAAMQQDLNQAMQAARWRLEAGNTLALEAGLQEEVASVLRAAYSQPAQGSGELAGRSDFGGAQWLQRQSAGAYEAASDPRKDGCALAL